jgi:15-cis-phytoene synthase
MPASSPDPAAFQSRAQAGDGTVQGDIAACRALLKEGSKSFHAASLLLPQRVRSPASALYAFCRVADDAIDNAGTHAALARLGTRLDRAYAGQPENHPVDRAFAHCIMRYALPRAVPDALLEGFLWDIEGRIYRTQADLEDYCVRVAGTVGVMMALIMERRSPEALARASDLGIAMQLTNIARDVGEDQRNGRLYLPHDWLIDAGIEPAAFMAKPVLDSRFRHVMRRLLALADTYYERARGGIALLPIDCRPAIHAARLIYGEIGRRIEQAGLDSLTQRAVTPRSRKLELLAQAFAETATGVTGPAMQPADAARFVIEAVADEPMPAGASYADRILVVIDLFERLERRDRDRRATYPHGQPA